LRRGRADAGGMVATKFDDVLADIHIAVLLKQLFLRFNN
jgi:hypothetical protein